jgi:hypothetical protein
LRKDVGAGTIAVPRGAGIERNDGAHNIKPSAQSLPLTQPVPRSERSMGSVWPQFVEMGIVAEEAIPTATLATKVRSAVVEAGSQIEWSGPGLRMGKNLTVPSSSKTI